MPPAKSKSAEEPTFEAAMARLDEIVREMESARLPLEDLLTRYEEGTRLVKSCAAKLEAAEQRIQIIRKEAGGALAVEPFEGEEPEPSH